MAGVFDLELNEAQADLEDISDEEEAIEIADDQLEVMPLRTRCAAMPQPGPRPGQAVEISSLVQHQLNL